jgi:cytosine/adenosine deaminase-related metal-dependent hydrolase
MAETNAVTLQPGRVLLLVVDLQERLLPFIAERERVVKRSVVMIRAARALGLQRERGALQSGLAADLAVWSVDSLDELGYWAGFNPCNMVVKEGEIALERAV